MNKYSRKGVLYEKLLDHKVRCYSCGHKCIISDGNSGVCKVRFNRNGELYVPYGYVSGIALDPIEKKPFFHVMPGSTTLSFGMLGCDFHCSFCQNWEISQSGRDEDAISSVTKVDISHFKKLMKKQEVTSVISTYNEPLITAEWSVEIFKEAKKMGLKTGYVSNGNANEKVINYLKPYLKLFKVDLKSFSEENYRNIGGRLKTVLDTIVLLKKNNFWVEIVTLVIPKFNDSDKELKDIAKFIASVSNDIPWHVTAFHRDYKMNDRDNTIVDSLIRAVKIGYSQGLHYVYAGNVYGTPYENTYCHNCKNLLVERTGYNIIKNIIQNGTCPNCLTKISGVW